MWPQKIIVIDDDGDVSLEVKGLLEDLSWAASKPPGNWDTVLRAYTIEFGSISLCDALRALADTHPNFFEGKVHAFNIDSVADVVSALTEIDESSELLAFLDCHLEWGGNDARQHLYELYHQLPASWQWATDAIDALRGACVYAHHIDPSPVPPLRVLVPATQNPPSGLRAASESNRAITRNCSWRGGTERRLQVLVTGLCSWVDLATNSPNQRREDS